MKDAEKKIHCDFVVKLCGKINTSIVRVSVRDYWRAKCSCQVLENFGKNDSTTTIISQVVQNNTLGRLINRQFFWKKKAYDWEKRVAWHKPAEWSQNK